jgi:tetratricopeptide (TPR) repeat protein
MSWSWLLCLWPGLPPLWRRGAWSGLGVACGYAAVLNLLLLSSLVWMELAGPAALRLAWLGLGLSWGGISLWSLWHGPPESQAALPAGEQDLFPRALNEYLRGNWFEAEVCLSRLLEAEPGDVDSRLLLASLLRRSGRWEAARRELERLERFERAAKWGLEIGRERQRLLAAEAVAPGSVELWEAA